MLKRVERTITDYTEYVLEHIDVLEGYTNKERDKQWIKENVDVIVYYWTSKDRLSDYALTIIYLNKDGRILEEELAPLDEMDYYE